MNRALSNLHTITHYKHKSVSSCNMTFCDKMLVNLHTGMMNLVPQTLPLNGSLDTPLSFLCCIAEDDNLFKDTINCHNNHYYYNVIISIQNVMLACNSS